MEITVEWAVVCLLILLLWLWAGDALSQRNEDLACGATGRNLSTQAAATGTRVPFQEEPPAGQAAGTGPGCRWTAPVPGFFPPSARLFTPAALQCFPDTVFAHPLLTWGGKLRISEP